MNGRRECRFLWIALAITVCLACLRLALPALAADAAYTTLQQVM